MQCQGADDGFHAITKIFKEFGFTQTTYSYGSVVNAPGHKNDLKLEKIVTTHSTLQKSRYDFYTGEYNFRRLFDVDPAITPFHHGNDIPFISGLHFSENGMLDPEPQAQQFVEMKSDAMGGAQLVFPVMTPATSRVPSGSITANSDLQGLKLKKATRQIMSIMPELIDIFVEKAAPFTNDLIVEGFGVTPREKECLQYMARGYRTIDIADQLGRSKSMIDKHVINARNKLQARSLAEAIARALQFKIIEL